MGACVAVKDWMSTDLVTATPDTPFAELARSLAAHRIRHIPIVVGAKLRGLVSNRDMLGARPADAGQGTLLATHIMSRKLRTVSPDECLSEAGDQLLREKLGCFPVVDGQGTLVGILSESDFVRFARRQLNCHHGEGQQEDILKD